MIFALGMLCTLIALGNKEGGHLSLIAPIYNINTLWAMLVGLIFFKEAKQVSVPYAVAGALLITIGGGLVGLAKR